MMIINVVRAGFYELIWILYVYVIICTIFWIKWRRCGDGGVIRVLHVPHVETTMLQCLFF